MAYKTEVLKQKAVAAIEKHRLIFFEDVIAMIGISKPCFYDHFIVDSDDFNDIKDLLEKNKIDIKVSIRYKWSKSDNPTAQMALYKLCSTAEEHRKLQQNYNEVTGKDGDSLLQPLTPEERAERIALLKAKL